MQDRDIGRRNFLARIGVLGVVLATAGLAGERPAGLAVGAGLSTASLRQVLAELARDTLNGLVVMTCPGPDPYSAAQGTPRTEPGALEARATDFLIESLDNFAPLPDQLSTALGYGLVTGLDGSGVALPAQLTSMSPHEVRTLDALLRELLRNDETLPLSALIALLLNLGATQVNPGAVSGTFLSPFARLSFGDKCAVFERMEGPDAQLVATLDSRLTEPLKGTVAGMLRFVAGALLEFSAYGSYGEWGVYDPAARTVRGRPVGWELSGYQPNGVVHGWDEFIGYYQGRKQVEGS